MVTSSQPYSSKESIDAYLEFARCDRSCGMDPPLCLTHTVFGPMWRLAFPKMGFNYEELLDDMTVDEFVRELDGMVGVIEIGPVGNDYASMLLPAARSHGFMAVSVRWPEKCWFLDTRAYPVSLSSKMRKNIRYYSRRIRATFSDVPFDGVSYCSFLELHKDGFLRGPFHDPRFVEYVRRLCVASHAHFISMSKDGKTVAMLLVIDWDGVRHYLNVGITHDMRKAGGEYAAIDHMVMDAKSKGIGLVNFGQSGPYKAKWGCVPQQGVSVLLCKPSDMREKICGVASVGWIAFFRNFMRVRSEVSSWMT
jgi:hypothetical protein